MKQNAKLVRKNVTSLYEQIASQLRQEIHSNRYEPSGKLPSEAELCEYYGVSRITVRLAIGKLVEEGSVERKQGKGTYVAGKQVRHGLDAIRSFHDSLVMQGLKPEMQLLEKVMQPLPESIQASFSKRTKSCVLLKRLHLVDNQPIALGISYLPACIDAVSWDIAERQPNYTLIQNSHHQGVVRADISISCQIADRSLARILKIKTGMPLLVMTRISSFANGECCDHSTFYIRPEGYSFITSCSF
ncbi:GntR family transcriptional regulator [Undibacterium sp. SXout7W]|uniref:GntR family transcriptional regulator n=1 Tax=Undibacterium sp. SXout7W TaxID=3413049 RepID=UPI003BF2EA93